jgi:hypothetical protein
VGDLIAQADGKDFPFIMSQFSFFIDGQQARAVLSMTNEKYEMRSGKPDFARMDI